MSKVKFRIDLQEADRNGVAPMLFEGHLIGMSADPLTSASWWLMKNKGAKPGDGIELYQNGVHRLYTLPKADNDKETPSKYPDDTGDPDDPGDEGDIDSPKAPKKGKKKAEPEPKDTCDDQDESYQEHVRAAAHAILAAGAKARGQEPPKLPTRAYPSDADVYAAERAAGLPVSPSAAAIVAAGKRRRGEIV